MVLCGKINLHTRLAFMNISIISTAVTLAMEFEVDSFTVESVISGYNIYEEVWSSVMGEVLVYCHW